MIIVANVIPSSSVLNELIKSQVPASNKNLIDFLKDWYTVTIKDIYDVGNAL